MQYHWLNKSDNKDLIIFFGGWSFDYKPFEYLDCGNNDVLMFYDYTDLKFSLDEILGNKVYEKVRLIAWSMGVFVAFYLKDELPKLADALAINGTPYPIDDERGIPHRTFDLTLQYAEIGLKDKFYKNVFSNEAFLIRYLKTPVERSVDSRVIELESLNEFIKETNQTYDNEFYQRAIVGIKDKIIPTKNQLNCWGNIAIRLDCGHFPFYNFESWEDILECR